MPPHGLCESKWRLVSNMKRKGKYMRVGGATSSELLTSKSTGQRLV